MLNFVALERTLVWNILFLLRFFEEKIRSTVSCYLKMIPNKISRQLRRWLVNYVWNSNSLSLLSSRNDGNSEKQKSDLAVNIGSTVKLYSTPPTRLHDIVLRVKLYSTPPIRLYDIVLMVKLYSTPPTRLHDIVLMVKLYSTPPTRLHDTVLMVKLYSTPPIRLHDIVLMVKLYSTHPYVFMT
jgi:hypothetical protein